MNNILPIPAAPEKEGKSCTLDDAIELCQIIELVCPSFGCHVALTGGTLYKPGERKDIDILFYRIRQVEKIDLDGMWSALEIVGLKKLKGFGWCYKGIYKEMNIDMFFPEEQGGEYKEEYRSPISV